MEDLQNSPFLDERTIEFLKKLLRGDRVTPLNANEQKLELLKPAILELNERLDHLLVDRIISYKTTIPTIVSIKFLLGAHRKGMLDDAVEVLEVARNDLRTASLKELVDILKDSKEMPAEWAVALKAHETDDRHKPDEHSNLSGLNLEAMKNFK